jgi:hypothetical protein
MELYLHSLIHFNDVVFNSIQGWLYLLHVTFTHLVPIQIFSCTVGRPAPCHYVLTSVWTKVEFEILTAVNVEMSVACRPVTRQRPRNKELYNGRCLVTVPQTTKFPRPLGFSRCELLLLLWEACSWGRRQFGNPEEGERPPLGATAEQRLMKTWLWTLVCVIVICKI